VTEEQRSGVKTAGVDLAGLQRAAEAEGRRCVVGALIRDEHGRVFVHRRGWERSFLPGCWDIVGGHVEGGEGLLEALEREVAEETGWTVAGEPALVYVADWDAPGEPPTARREFDFLVRRRPWRQGTPAAGVPDRSRRRR
jgi:8-oxo-dGTP diphosphatase